MLPKLASEMISGNREGLPSASIRGLPSKDTHTLPSLDHFVCVDFVAP